MVETVDDCGYTRQSRVTCRVAERYEGGDKVLLRRGSGRACGGTEYNDLDGGGCVIGECEPCFDDLGFVFEN
ncbi:hypothetical protein HanIR_Chr05g0255251 [Helianthus annuus]|nr:hypothetical protein HanIR_Chr05g0255251 [Helianthus annuus]